MLNSELTLDAKVEKLNTVLEFLEEEMNRYEVPMRTQIQLNVAVEEIFVNIAYYAYAPSSGTATIKIKCIEDPRSLVITFIDSGMEYNPLEREDPDVTLPAEERQIGGLGIYMVKKSMDSMEYERKDDQNVLTIRKTF